MNGREAYVPFRAGWATCNAQKANNDIANDDSQHSLPDTEAQSVKRRACGSASDFGMIACPALFAVKYFVTHAVYGMGNLVRSLLRFHPWFKEYTPEALLDVAGMWPRREEVLKSGRGKSE